MSEPSAPIRSSSGFRRLITTACGLAIAIAFYYILSLGRHFFVPLVISFLVVYLVDILSRLVGRVQIAGHKIPKLLTVIVSFVLIFGVGCALTSIVANNAFHVAAAAPKYQARLQQLQTAGFQPVRLGRTTRAPGGVPVTGSERIFYRLGPIRR